MTRNDPMLGLVSSSTLDTCAALKRILDGIYLCLNSSSVYSSKIRYEGKLYGANIFVTTFIFRKVNNYGLCVRAEEPQYLLERFMKRRITAYHVREDKSSFS